MYKIDYLQNGAKRVIDYGDVVHHSSPRAALALLLGALILRLVATASTPWHPPPPTATTSSTTAPAAFSTPAARILDIYTYLPSPGVLQISIKVVLYTHIYIFMSKFVNLGRKKHILLPFNENAKKIV